MAEPLVALRDISDAVKRAPVVLTSKQSTTLEATLAKLVLHSERVAARSPEGAAEAEDCGISLTNLLEALLQCLARSGLHSRAVILLAAANHVLASMCGSKGVSQKVQADIMGQIQALRRRGACTRSPERPVVSLSLVGVLLTQLEAGAACLPISGERGAAASAGVKMVMGAAKSFAMMKIDDDLLKGTKELLQVGGTMARRQFARPCYTELLLIDQTGCERKRGEAAPGAGGNDGGGQRSFRELFILRERHFGTYGNGRWEAKAAVAWAITAALVGSEARGGIGSLPVELVQALCIDEQFGLVSMISAGDAIGATPDRAATASSTLFRLGSIMVDTMVHAKGGAVAADQVDEWMETVLELVQGQLRLLGDEVRGGIAVHLSQLGHLLSSHGNDEKLDRLCTQIAERIVRASGAAGAGATATAEAGLSELLGGAKAVCAAARSVQDGVARASELLDRALKLLTLLGQLSSNPYAHATRLLERTREFALERLRLALAGVASKAAAEAQSLVGALAKLDPARAALDDMSSEVTAVLECARSQADSFRTLLKPIHTAAAMASLLRTGSALQAVLMSLGVSDQLRQEVARASESACAAFQALLGNGSSIGRPRANESHAVPTVLSLLSEACDVLCSVSGAAQSSKKALILEACTSFERVGQMVIAVGPELRKLEQAVIPQLSQALSQVVSALSAKLESSAPKPPSELGKFLASAYAHLDSLRAISVEIGTAASASGACLERDVIAPLESLHATAESPGASSKASSSGIGDTLLDVGRSLSTFRPWRKSKSKTKGTAQGDSFEEPIDVLVDVEGEKRRVLGILIDVREAIDGAVAKMGHGADGDDLENAEEATAGTLAASFSTLEEVGQRLVAMLGTDYSALSLPPLPEIGVGLGLLASALEGVKAELEGLKGVSQSSQRYTNHPTAALRKQQ